MSAASKASEAMFDVRDDEDNAARLADCVGLLVAAGYFRARLKGVQPFDKIIGGMVWCISTCNFTVDVDLLYAENATIGQKIALTEKIVAVLPLLACPHSIEPHQIQGLDFIHIFPWLVRRAVEAREEHGNAAHLFVDYLHEQEFGKTIPQPSEASKLASKLIALRASAGAPRRVFRRADGVVTTSLPEDLQYTLAEYAQGRLPLSTPSTSSDPGTGNEDIRDETAKQLGGKLTTASGSKGTTLSALSSLEPSRVIDGKSGNSPQSATSPSLTLADVRARIEQARAESSRLDEVLAEQREKTEKEEEQAAEKKEKLRQYQEIEGRFDESEIAALRALYDQYTEQATAEQTFKRECRAALTHLQEQLEGERRKAEKGREENDEESLARLASLTREVDDLRMGAAEAMHTTSKLQRDADSIPSQLELEQYYKRIMELANEVGSEHSRLKRLFIEYNTLVDVKDALVKTRKLHDDVEEIVTKSTGDYRDNLLERQQTVLRGLESTLDKKSAAERLLEIQREELQKESNKRRDSARQYARTVEKLAKAHERNAALHATRSQLPEMKRSIDERRKAE